MFQTYALIQSTCWLREHTTHDVVNPFDESGCGSWIKLWPNTL